MFPTFFGLGDLSLLLVLITIVIEEITFFLEELVL